MADPQFGQYLNGKVQTFNPYGAGRKVYGNGSFAPNVGPTSSPDGYRTRDLQARARKQAMMAKLKDSNNRRRNNGSFSPPAGGPGGTPPSDAAFTLAKQKDSRNRRMP